MSADDGRVEGSAEVVDVGHVEQLTASAAAKLIRQARAKLDKMEVRGSGEWNRFLRDSKRDLSKTLGKLERSVRPKPASKIVTKEKRASHSMVAIARRGEQPSERS